SFFQEVSQGFFYMRKAKIKSLIACKCCSSGYTIEQHTGIDAFDKRTYVREEAGKRQAKRSAHRFAERLHKGSIRNRIGAARMINLTGMSSFDYPLHHPHEIPLLDPADVLTTIGHLAAEPAFSHGQ